MTSFISEQTAEEQRKDNDVVLSVQGVSKKFCRSLRKSLLYGVQDVFGEVIGTRTESKELRPQEFWALKDVSFELHRGEVLGLLGANGAGKTTLLRMIGGLIKPDTGVIDIKGKIAPLIALGAGFNPVLTGRENIYANMSVLGLTKQEIDERFDAVVDFAEVGDALDAPVMTYSSGMQARLGFACAIHVEPDILLLDEVLAVGDTKFRSKCTHRLHELRKKGTSILLVNHNTLAVLALSDRAIFLKKGETKAMGDASSIVTKYEEALFSQTACRSEGQLQIPEKQSTESLGCDITKIYFRDSDNQIISSPTTGQTLTLCIRVKTHRYTPKLSVFLFFTDIAKDNTPILTISNTIDHSDMDLTEGKHELIVEFPCLHLKPSLYNLRIDIRENNFSHLDAVEQFSFTIKPNPGINTSRSELYQPRRWRRSNCV